MEFTQETVAGLCLASALLGCVMGFWFAFPETKKYMRLRLKPLTYYELINLPVGTEVRLVQYALKGEGSGFVEHGIICMKSDGNKAVNVGDGKIEFTKADVWLD